MREPTRASDAHRLEVRSDAITAPATDPRVARVLALQRTIGNRLVGRALARWPLPAGAPVRPAPGGAPVKTPAGGSPAKAPAAAVVTVAPVPPTPNPPMLTPNARKLIRLNTRDRILIALPFFISALDQNVAAIKAEEKAKAEWAAAIVEIFIGIAAPVFARLLVNRGGVAQKLAADLAAVTKTSKTAKHVSAAKTAAEAAKKAEAVAWEAAKAKAELKLAQDAAKAAGKSRSVRKEAQKAAREAEAAAQRAARRAAELEDEATAAQEAYAALAPVELISDSELLKETMKGAVKATTSALKQNVQLLWGEDDVNAFALKLEVEFHYAAEELTHKLNEDTTNQPDSEGAHFNDLQLVALYVTYDPGHTNIDAYRTMLKTVLEDFRTYVRPIKKGDWTPHSTKWKQSETKNDVRGVWVKDTAGRKRLYVLEEEQVREGSRVETSVKFTGPVPPGSVKAVIDRTEAEFGKGSIQTIDWGEALHYGVKA
jgi:hypothetical protein